MFGSTKRNRSANNDVAYHDGTTVTTRPSLFQRLLRTLQFLSSLTSLILFSIRLRKIIKLTHRASNSNGAVEGILAAAVLYTLLAMLMKWAVKGTGSNLLRMLFVILDILFVGAFIAVAVLTSPKRHGSSSPCNATRSAAFNTRVPSQVNCNLPWGTFILAIVSTLLHAATAAHHAAKDHKRTKRNSFAAKEAHHDHHNTAMTGDAHTSHAV